MVAGIVVPCGPFKFLFGYRLKDLKQKLAKRIDNLFILVQTHNYVIGCAPKTSNCEMKLYSNISNAELVMGVPGPNTPTTPISYRRS